MRISFHRIVVATFHRFRQLLDQAGNGVSFPIHVDAVHRLVVARTGQRMLGLLVFVKDALKKSTSLQIGLLLGKSADRNKRDTSRESSQKQELVSQFCENSH